MLSCLPGLTSDSITNGTPGSGSTLVLLNKSNKIIIETRNEKNANKIGFTIFSLSRKKFYIKPFSDKV